MNSGVRTGLVVAVIAASLGSATFGAEHEWTFRPQDSVSRADPPIPDAEVQLIVDDDTPEGELGVGVPNAQQFLWFNRFTPGPVIPIRLDEIWVLFPAGPNMAVGADIQLVVYHDPDGDPSNGADLVASFDETTQFVDGNTFSIYALNPGLVIHHPGDILIGVVDRFVDSGVTTTTRPAAMDTTASQGRSWIAVWNTDPPDPPLLPADNTFQTVDGFVPGNWMIRAFGQSTFTPAIPTQNTTGLVLLIILLGLGGVILIVRRT